MPGQPPSSESRESLRGLTGAGPSTVGVEKAMRARDVSRERSARRRGEPVRDAGPAERGGYSEGGAGSSGSSPVDS